MGLVDCFSIVSNEEELFQYTLESYESFVDLIGVVSIVENNCTDLTLDIINSFKTRLPIHLFHHRENSHHGEMRTLALSVCKSPWIFYLDADETITNDFHVLAPALREDAKIDQYRFYKYATVYDKYHFINRGNGYTQRLFRNYPGVHFPQSIHTEPTAGDWCTYDLPQSSVVMFDHTHCKSPEALWAKGWRYKWANREQVPGVGGPDEYVWRESKTLRDDAIEPFVGYLKERIFTGPVDHHYHYETLIRGSE